MSHTTLPSVQDGSITGVLLREVSTLMQDPAPYSHNQLASSAKSRHVDLSAVLFPARVSVDAVFGHFLRRTIYPPQEEQAKYFELAAWVISKLKFHHSVDNCYISGSFGRETSTRPLNDVDIVAVLKIEYDDDSVQLFEALVEGIGVGADVEEVAGCGGLYQVCLEEAVTIGLLSLSRFLIRRQQVSIGVCFTNGADWDDAAPRCDIVPAVVSGKDGSLLIQSGLHGKTKTNPLAAKPVLDKLNHSWNGCIRDLVRLLKYFNANCDAPRHKLIKSFHMESLCIAFASRSRPLGLTFALGPALSYIANALANDAGCSVPGAEDSLLRNREFKKPGNQDHHEPSLESLVAKLLAAGKEAEAATSAEVRDDIPLALKHWAAVFGTQFTAAVEDLRASIKRTADDFFSTRPLLSAIRDGDQARVIAELASTRQSASLAPQLLVLGVLIAIAYGHVEVMQSLLLEVSEDSFRDSLSPLHLAIDCGNARALRVLLDLGFNTTSLLSPVRNFTLLENACFRGHVECVQLLLDHGVSPEQLPGRQSPIFYGALKKSLPIVQLLLSRHSPRDLDDALFAACGTDCVDVVKLFLELKANANSRFSGETPLTVAAESGSVHVARLLLDYGADVNAINLSGNSPLNNAVIRQHSELVELLLERGANPNSLQKGTPLLVHACAGGNGSIVRSLLKHGARPDDSAAASGQSGPLAQTRGVLSHAAIRGHIDVLCALINFGLDPNGLPTESTALFHAIYGGSLKAVKFLLTCHRIDVNRRMPISGRTALHLAATRSAEMIKLLLDAGGEVNMLDARGSSPLYYACINGIAAAAFLLLSRGASAELAGPKSTPPLYEACVLRMFDVCKSLILHGANPSVTFNETGKCPVHEAARIGDLPLLQLFLANGANVHAVLDEGSTLVHTAAFYGHLPIIEYLVSGDILPCDKPNSVSQTPLMLAVMGGHTEIARYLLSKPNGAKQIDLTPRNEDETALFTACRLGFSTIARMLLQAGANPNARTVNNSTPLVTTVIHRRLSLAQHLVASGALVDAHIGRGESFTTPLHLALACECPSLSLQWLEASRAHLSIPNGNGQYPLLLAAMNGYTDVVRRLLALGVDAKVGKRNADESVTTAYVLALSFGHIGTALLLPPVKLQPCTFVTKQAIMGNVARNDVRGLAFVLDLGADPNFGFQDGNSPLEKAMSLGFHDVASILIEKANLHAAIYLLSAPLVEQLLQRGDDPNAAVDEVTPLLLAVLTEAKDLVRILLQGGANPLQRSGSHPCPFAVVVAQGCYDILETILAVHPRLVEDNSSRHFGVRCDGCLQDDFRGTRYHSKILDDTDFCDECYRKRKESRDFDFDIIDVPAWLLAFRKNAR